MHVPHTKKFYCCGNSGMWNVKTLNIQNKVQWTSVTFLYTRFVEILLKTWGKNNEIHYFACSIIINYIKTIKTNVLVMFSDK